jgi:hypothetical protein
VTTLLHGEFDGLNALGHEGAQIDLFALQAELAAVAPVFFCNCMAEPSIH